jgi:hypothetical protein
MPKVEIRSWPNWAMRIVIPPQQHVDDVGLTEALAGAVDARQAFCAATVPSNSFGGSAQVSQLPHGSPVVAEIGQEHLPAAARRLGQSEQRIELLPLHALALFGRVRFLDEAAAQRDVVVSRRASACPRAGRRARRGPVS